MDFRLTDDQEALRRGTRELLAARFGRDALHRAAGDPRLDRALWRELGEAGFFALALPEAEGQGGVGLGLPESVLVFEEAGRALLPGPLAASWLAAGRVPGAAEGTVVVTALDLAADPAAGLAADPVADRTGLERTAPVPVEHLEAAGRVLVLDGDAPPRAVSPEALRTEPVRSVDPLSPLHRVTGVSVGEPVPGAPGEGVLEGADAARFRREGALLTAAQQLGSAVRTVETAVAYAREREQFGQPIGGFQAVKHLCAEMLVRAETARSVVYAASVTEDESETAAAKLLADEAAVRNARDCLQVHGGMGFTWEADVHLHLKRAWLRAEQWQSVVTAEEKLAAVL